MSTYPPTRFMGSKESLLPELEAVFTALPAGPALDLFSGSGVVSHRLKALGRPVLANDHMAMCATFTRAMVENPGLPLGPAAVEALLAPAPDADGFVARTFDGLYFDAADTALIDTVRANLKRLTCPYRRALGLSALLRACLKKRPRGIFTYTGLRYDDGRRDLRLTLAEHLRAQAALVDAALIADGPPCRSLWGDALAVPAQEGTAVVYLDPPYFSPLSDNEYVRRYHFLEGLARDWQGVAVQWHTKTRKFARYPTPFATLAGAREAFATLFARHREAGAVVVSWSSNALPGRDDLAALLRRTRRRVEVVELPHRYSIGTQKAGQRNQVREYVLIGE